jgi:Zn-dependent peptidase ImmA (M78 family)
MTTKYVLSLPDSIRVGPYDMRIVKVEKINDKDEYFGMFEGAKETISIILEQPSKHRAADTMMHELLHAIWYTVTPSGEEEQTVGSVSTALVQVFRDNPALLTWFKLANE